MTTLLTKSKSSCSSNNKAPLGAFAKEAKRLVIKFGTGLLTSGQAHLDFERIQGLCKAIASLHEQGFEVILVSSGSIGMGMKQLGLNRRPTHMHMLQACASIGQNCLMDTWKKGFEPFDLTVAQLLLTHDDVRTRKRHVGIKNLLEELLKQKVIPIINENDSVSTEEIKFGDNDILSALVASLTKADLLAILSTAPGLLDLKGSGELIPVVETITPKIEAMAGGTTSPTAVGGMISKIHAAKVATRSGCNTFIGSGYDPQIIEQLASGSATGTLFMSKRLSMRSRKRWIAFFQKSQGTLTVDAGAQEALISQGKSLLAKGITQAEGSFKEGALVDILDTTGTAFARGIATYSSQDLQTIPGSASPTIREQFPKRKRLEVIHRDSLVIL